MNRRNVAALFSQITRASRPFAECNGGLSLRRCECSCPADGHFTRGISTTNSSRLMRVKSAAETCNRYNPQEDGRRTPEAERSENEVTQLGRAAMVLSQREHLRRKACRWHGRLSTPCAQAGRPRFSAVQRPCILSASLDCYRGFNSLVRKWCR
jgi:hypothetical protein